MIRLATPRDRPAVEAVVEEAYAPYVPRLGRKPMPMLDDYAALIAAGRVHVLDGSDGIVGVLVLIPEDDAMLLDNVALAARARGQGHGRALLLFAEAAARAAGFRTIRLLTNAGMVENIALYGRIGYVETHRWGDDGIPRVFMRKGLAPGTGPGAGPTGRP